MPKEIKSYEVFDCLKTGREVRFIDYERNEIIDITGFSVRLVQKYIDRAEQLSNDFMTHFYIMEVEDEKDL